MKLLDQRKNQRDAGRRQQQRDQLIRREAAIGGQLFGPVPRRSTRAFFCLNQTTWVWHEEWIDDDGQRQVVTTRYEVRPNGILKAHNGQNYRYIDDREAKNLYDAINAYYKRSLHEIYGFAAA
jgi:hypothetical protein